MANFLMLGKFTGKCFQELNEMPGKIQKFKSICEEEGARVLSYNVLMGKFDVACMLEAQNEETVAKIALIVGKRGNASTQTLRAFDENEFTKIVKELK